MLVLVLVGHPPPPRYVWPIALTGDQCRFFVRQLLTVNELPDRPVVDRRPRSGSSATRLRTVQA
jgi:hypothetical protein